MDNNKFDRQNFDPETAIKIADFKFAFKGIPAIIWDSFKEYKTNCVNLDEVFEITPEAVERTRLSDENEGEIGGLYYEYLTILRNIAEWAPKQNAFLMHGVVLDIENTGILFTAQSGTGKTTHMNLWQEYLGDKMVVVNGDKPIVRFFDNEPETPYAYGTPWCGKEWLQNNMRTPLKHICFIERSETNYVERVDKATVIDRIFNQIYMPKDPVAIMKTMELIDRLLNCCNLWIIHCNMEKDAAKIAHEAIFNDLPTA